jgi:hypothetical protein
MERRRHSRAPEEPRYKRLRQEIDPPTALADATCGLFGWFAQTAHRMRSWLRGSRKLAQSKAAEREPA